MKYLTLILVSFLYLSANAQDEAVDTDSEIKSVTVFLNGAQVHRQATVTLSKGNNEIKLIGLSQYITNNSVQVKGNSGYKIVSVKHKVNYLKEAKKPTELKVLELQLKEFDNKLDLINDENEALRSERDMILSNQKIAGREVAVDVIELTDIADFYRNRLNQIDIELLENKKDEKEIYRSRDNVYAQMREIGYSKYDPTSEILVKISSERTGPTTLEFNYMVSSCGWEPTYDIRSQDVTGPIELTYKGNVRQNTGVDWNNIKLTLSTGNPSISGTKPEFVAWRVYGNDETENYDKRSGGIRPKGAASQNKAYGEIDEPEEEKSVADMTTMTETAVSTEFKIDLPYTILSDNKKLAVEVKKYSLPAQYSYLAVPKLDPDAFLIGKISGWDNYNILSGWSNIYYQGTFVGQSYINTYTAADTLTISLGRDNNVVVQRKKVKDYCSNQVIGSNKKTEVGMEISLKNTKKSTVEILIQDHIPLSTSKDVEVDLDESGGGKFNETTGFLEYTFILGPGESKSIRYKYTVKRPKDYEFSNL